MTYFQVAGCPFTGFLRFLSSFRLSLIWLLPGFPGPLFLTALGFLRPHCSPTVSGVSAYIPCARVFPISRCEESGVLH